MARRTAEGDRSYSRTARIRGREAEGLFAVIVQRDRTRIARIRADGTADADTEELVPTSDLIDIRKTYRVPVGQRGAVILPSELRRDLTMREGSMLQIIQEPDGRLTVTCLPESPTKVDLDTLLSQITPENIHEEFDMGPPVGREIL